tara:strand:+ start:78 stop:1226 length:1149 start_codon:yes stop_codon:yes gene_type:complete
MGIFDFLKNKKKGNEGGVSSKIDISSTNDADIQENHKSNKSGLPNFEEVSENKYDNEGVFETKVKEIFAQFEKDLNSENFKDFPVPYWYDIVKGRADSMKADSLNRTPIDVQNEWTWMHADEYKTKYQSVSKDESIQSMSLRVERFGYIFKLLCSLENQLHDLVKEYNLRTNPFLEQFDWDKASSAASLYGSINFALSVGMSKEEITKLYSDFVYDENLINGTDPFATRGYTKEDAYKMIKDNLGIDNDNIKAKQIQINKKISSLLSQLTVEKRYAVFTILCHIANSDGVSDGENIILQDISLELEIDVNEYNNSKMDGNKACDLLQNLNQEQKDEFSRLIILIVGADGDFSSQEMMWVNDVIREIGLDDNLLIELIEKYWN